MIYWDTSCVLKLYTPEADSDVFLQMADAAELPLLSSAVLRVELYFALSQKELRREIRNDSAERLAQAFDRDVAAGRFLLLPVGGDVLAAARDAERTCRRHRPVVVLRSLDGIHLGSAVVGRAEAVATVDQRMRAAAALLGLRLLPSRIGP